MGTTKYCVLLSERPEYNDKIIAGFLMGPATSMTNAYFPLLVDLADEAENIQDSLHEQGMQNSVLQFLR